MKTTVLTLALAATLAGCATPEQLAQRAADKEIEQRAFVRKMTLEVWAPACERSGITDRGSKEMMDCVMGMYDRYQAELKLDAGRRAAAAQVLRDAGQARQRQPIQTAPSPAITPAYTRCAPAPGGAVNCTSF